MNILDLNDHILRRIFMFLWEDVNILLETCKELYTLAKETLKKSKIRRLHHYELVISKEMIEWAKSHPCFKKTLSYAQFAARRNDFKILKYLHSQGFPFGSYVWIEATEHENFEILKWCYARKIPSHYFAFSKAAEMGNIKLLKLFRNYGFSMHPDVMSSAAHSGYFNVVKWLVKNDCPFNATSFYYAAGRGDLKVLKYLYKVTIDKLIIDPRWDPSICARAAKYNRIKTLKWLRNEGFIWNAFTTYRAAQKKNIETLKWCIENSCPIDRLLFNTLEEDFGLTYLPDECNIIDV